MNKLIITVMMGFLAISSQALAVSADDEIQHLLQFVGESNAVFIRNGQEYQPKEAADHLAKKWESLKDQIVSAEDFIRLVGTKSLLSGKVYLVKQKNGETQESSEWLSEELNRYRKQKK